MTTSGAEVKSFRNIVMKEIEAGKARAQSLKQTMSDYISLEQLLTDLPKACRQDCMVPFSKVAFVPGYLNHTNELMVLLGDNWFVKRTTFEARDVITRRLKTIQEEVKSVQKHLDLLGQRYEVKMSDDRETMNIEEHYDENGVLSSSSVRPGANDPVLASQFAELASGHNQGQPLSKAEQAAKEKEKQLDRVLSEMTAEEAIDYMEKLENEAKQAESRQAKPRRSVRFQDTMRELSSPASSPADIPRHIDRVRAQAPANDHTATRRPTIPPAAPKTATKPDQETEAASPPATSKKVGPGLTDFSIRERTTPSAEAEPHEVASDTPLRVSRFRQRMRNAK